MKHEGPFRENPDQDATYLKKMEAKIEDERRLSLKLPDNVHVGGDLPFFAEMCGAIDPKDIVLYSLATGILRYSQKETNKLYKIHSYAYSNPDDPEVMLAVELPKKESRPAKIVKLTTKAEVEVDIKRRESSFKESEKQVLISAMNVLEKYIQITKGLIEKGVDKELEGTYFAELKELRTSLKLLLDTIDDKLEEKK